MNIKIRILFLLLIMFCAAASAQSGLNIEEIFENAEDYAGTTNEVRIKGKSLKQYKLTYFHSLTLNFSKKTADIMEDMVRKDSEKAESIKEVKRGDRTVGLYLQLPFESDEKRFILFRRPTEDNALLVYVEGPTTLDEIVKISFK